jgi:hypothetical protein
MILEFDDDNGNIMAHCKSDVCKLHILHPHDFDSIVNAHLSMKQSLSNLFYRREFSKSCTFDNTNIIPRKWKWFTISIQSNGYQSLC